jgi:hypothetical protein
MSRGRKRKPNPTIPAHIDQARIPKGLYWDGRGAGRWYVFEANEQGKPRPRIVAAATAKLSDLHAIAEKRQDVDRESLLWLCEQFEGSANFRKLAKSTRDSYTKSRKVLCGHKTKSGGTFGELQARKITRPLLQRLIDQIAAGHERDDAGQLIPTPTKAVHVLRYLGVMLRWGANRGHVEANAAEGLEAPEERKQHKMPTTEAFDAIVKYARANAHHGRGVRGKRGSCPSYLAPAAVIAYRCRLRGIEVASLTDAHVLPEGIFSNRRKGSRDNVTQWTPQLRQAVDELLARRKAIWNDLRTPSPLDPARRPLVVTIAGDPIRKSGFDTAWQRLIAAAIEDGVITAEQRFTFHGLKHKGITDTEGTRDAKQEASGHRSARMLDVYDHAVPLVPAAGEKLQKKPPGDPSPSRT